MGLDPLFGKVCTPSTEAAVKKSQASVRGILLAALAGAAGLGAAGSGLVSADGARFAGD